jgi:5-methylcytosine-specific restriction endonuclease McrA
MKHKWDIRHKERARKAGVAYDATPDECYRIKRKQKGRCCYCKHFAPLTLEHIIPISKGGGHTAKNIAFACDRCNNKKGNTDPFEFKRNGMSAIFLLNFVNR